jgi:flagellar basal body-associated protein FliL
MDTQTQGPNNADVNTEMKMPAAFSEKNHSQTGIILGVLIVVLVIILGGLYLWGASLSGTSPVVVPATPPIENNEPETPRAAADTQALKVVSSSDELDAIEADIESTNLNTLGSELDEIGRELGVTQ